MNDRLNPSMLKVFQKSTSNVFVEGCTLEDLLPEKTPNIFAFSALLPAPMTEADGDGPAPELPEDLETSGPDDSPAL